MTALGNNVLASAPGDQSGTNVGGAVYVFDGTTFDVPAGNGPNDLLLRRNGTNIEIVDNNTGNIAYTEPLKQSIIIAGADGEDDTLTVELQHSGIFGAALPPVSFIGGQNDADRLIIDSLGGGANTQMNYLPSGATPGAGLATEVVSTTPLPVPGDGKPILQSSTTIGFFGVEALEMAASDHNGVLSFITPNGEDDLSIDQDLGPDDISANTISGTSGGVSFAAHVLQRQ